MIKDIAAPITAFIASFLIVILLHPQLVKLALRKDIVDKPNARRLNRTPIPVLGGIGVFVAFIIGIFICAATFSITLPVVCLTAMATMLAVGLMDDIKDLKPKTKFIIQACIIAIIIFVCDMKIDNLHGILGIYTLPDYISIPLTLFACVGLINSINLIDGIDGLSSGYAIAASIMFFIFGQVQGNITNIIISASLIGALIPFFTYNVFGKKNKMFIGDSGSHFLGIAFCILTLKTLNSNNAMNITMDNSVATFCLAVMAHPVMDTLRVMTMRICNGNSPFKADKTHLHHAIINMGVSHLATTLIIISLNMAVVVIWYATFAAGLSANTQFIATLLSSILFIVTPYYIITNIKAKKA